MRTADGKAPKPGSLTAFCEELISRLPSRRTRTGRERR
jgi:hypothetical protein